MGFLTYVLSHPRPIYEVMAPRWKPLHDTFHSEFKGMTNEPIELSKLKTTRTDMMTALQAHFTLHDREFLLSFKQGKPNWHLFDEPKAADLPAIRWKLMNIQKLLKNKAKHEVQFNRLSDVLEKWLIKQ